MRRTMKEGAFIICMRERGAVSVLEKMIGRRRRAKLVVLSVGLSREYSSASRRYVVVWSFSRSPEADS
jgi:hypothetical protein